MGIEHLSCHDDDTHRRRIHQLRAAGRPEDRRLANALARCTEADPCRSGACIHCGRDFQRAAFDFIEQEIRVPALRDVRGRMSALTIVPPVDCLTPADLKASACRRVMADVVAALDACEVSTYALSLDISFNEDTTGKLEPHWCAHVHGATREWLSDSQEQALGEAFPPSRMVSRPVDVDHLDRNETGRLYIFKPDRVRRVTFRNDRNPKRRPYRDSARRTLRPWQAVALAHVEHELGFDYRLVTHGIDENAVGAALDAFYRARDGP